MFETGEWVRYGIHGVCRVMGIEKQTVNRKRTEYLVLAPRLQSKSRFYLPTDNPAAMAKLKPVLGEAEMRALLSSDTIRKDVWIDEENQRKQHYRDIMSGGDRLTLLQMVTSLYRYRAAQTASGRKFHQCDENFLRDAEKLLSSEISLVLNLTQEQARDYLRERLNPAS